VERGEALANRAPKICKRIIFEGKPGGACEPGVALRGAAGGQCCRENTKKMGDCRGRNSRGHESNSNTHLQRKSTSMDNKRKNVGKTIDHQTRCYAGLGVAASAAMAKEHTKGAADPRAWGTRPPKVKLFGFRW